MGIRNTIDNRVCVLHNGATVGMSTNVIECILCCTITRHRTHPALEQVHKLSFINGLTGSFRQSGGVGWGGDEPIYIYVAHDTIHSDHVGILE